MQGIKKWMHTAVVAVSLFTSSNKIFAQPDRWQQRIKYNINVVLDTAVHQLSGTEKIEYTNNSPDTLYKLFFHAYWNAFKPNSSMDAKSLQYGKLRIDTVSKNNDGLDWDQRVKDRISKLQPNEIGFQQIHQVIINGKTQQLIDHETIVEVVLDKPILPKSKTNIQLSFTAQVPKQIRRSGRNNAEGVQYSVSQWYPKMVEYDYQGWNANPYVAREFYGVWGNFEVTITAPKNLVIGGTGLLQNAHKIGHGYYVPTTQSPLAVPSTPTLTWHFIAENVHDFVWAADKDYIHLQKDVRKGLTVHVLYKKKDAVADSSFKNIIYAVENTLPFIEKKYGKYPYAQYSFIQGGDGGMEYPMATLIKNANLSTVFHEFMHSWYQHLLGTNESLYTFMDEGFTSYAENMAVDFYNKNFALHSPFISQNAKDKLLKEMQKDSTKLPAIHFAEYASYFKLAKSGQEEPLSTHADHFEVNRSSSAAAYSKGTVFLNQLSYIVGNKVLDKILLNYYDVWKYKHPNANDFIRIAEKTSGLSLQWYKEYWVNSIKTIDYKLGDVVTNEEGKPVVTVTRVGKMPMPVDVEITLKNGTKTIYHIPLNLQYGYKGAETDVPQINLPEWRWTHLDYTFTINHKITDIKKIEIDPSQRMADVNRLNNKIEVPQ